MSQQTSFSISRAPVSVRKMVKIIRDPVIFTGIAAVTVMVGFGTWYYYSNRSM